MSPSVGQNQEGSRDPDAALRRLRARVLGGGRPALEDLVGDDMAAANEMILRGEAEVVCTGCHLYLTATLHDPPSDSAEELTRGLRAVIGRILGGG
jgi:hypothetical protein